MNKQLMVKFGGGREGNIPAPPHAPFCCASPWLTRWCVTITTVTGILKGHDPLLNLVLDEVKERVRGKHTP